MAAAPRPIEASFIGRNRRAIVRYLMAKHALEAADAIPMRLATPAVQRAMAGLITRAIVHQAKPGRYYLDIAAWCADAEERRNRGVIIAVATALMLAVGAMLMYRDVSISLVP